MDDFKKLEQIFKEPITINNINRINDLFIRYLFSYPGNENIALNFINSVFKDSNFQPFKSIEILNPFNISENYNEKESIVDIKALTESGITVLIEIQARGNESFIKRSLYYWAYNYSSNLDRGEYYNELKPAASINIINFKLMNIDKLHCCFLLKELTGNQILTDHCQLHFISLPNFEYINNDFNKDFLSWVKFFKGENMSILINENTVFDEVDKKCGRFFNTAPFMDKYKKREIDTYFFNESIRIDLEKARNEGIEKGIEQGIEKGIEQGIEQGIEKGIEQGIEKGIEQSKIKIAKNLKKSGIDINIISENTGLSIEEIEKL